MSGTVAEGCSRRMSRSSFLCSGVSLRHRPCRDVDAAVAFEPAVLVRIVPALERRHREALRALVVRLAIALLGELPKRGDELASRQLAPRQRTDDLAP